MASDLPLLLAPRTLATHLHRPDLLVVDLSQPRVYEQAHVPGAVHLDPRRLQCNLPPAPGLPPSAEECVALLSELGLTADTHVVACDDEGGGWASRLLWLLDLCGHDRYSLLDGGIHAWLAEDLPTSDEPGRRAPASPLALTPRPRTQITLEELLPRLGDPGLVVWDTRSREEYEGLRAFAQRGGHLPGAVHYEWTEVMDKRNHLRLRPLSTLRQELAERGITPDLEVVVHCQTHHRSSLSWMVARILDYPDVRGYAGSWAEWGNHPATPIEKDLK